MLRATVRVVADAAGVSRQAVSDMRRRLAADNYIADTPSGARWLPRRRDDALELLLHGYRGTLRPSLLQGSYRTQYATPAELEQRIAPILDGELSEWRWGGNAAGHRLTGHYRGERTVIHVHATPLRFEKTLRALPDRKGNLVVLRGFGPIAWPVDSNLVHPLLVYSEILAEGTESAREAAQVLFEKCVLPRWQEAE